MGGRVRRFPAKNKVRVSPLQKDCQTLKKMSHGCLIVIGRALSDGVPDSLQLDDRLWMPAAESLDGQWTEDDVFRTTMVTMLFVLVIKTGVESETCIPCAFIDI